MRPHRLFHQLQGGHAAIGLWIGLDCPAAVEALSRAGLDWLLLDCEHGAPSTETLVPLLQAFGDSETSAIVRVPSADPVILQRVLDAGAEGVLLPQIRTAEEVERAVAATRYPPDGTRGIGPYRASAWFAEFPDYFAEGAKQITVIAQIETKEAVDHLDDIAAVEGLHGLLIGPADLSASLGHFPNTRHEECEAVAQRVVDVCQQHGLAAGYYCNGGADAKARLDQGFRLVNVGSDFGQMVRAARADAAIARGVAPAADTGPVV